MRLNPKIFRQNIQPQDKLSRLSTSDSILQFQLPYRCPIFAKPSNTLLLISIRPWSTRSHEIEFMCLGSLLHFCHPFDRHNGSPAKSLGSENPPVLESSSTLLTKGLFPILDSPLFLQPFLLQPHFFGAISSASSSAATLVYQKRFLPLSYHLPRLPMQVYTVPSSALAFV